MRSRNWESSAARVLDAAESVLLLLIGIALVLVAVMLLYSSLYQMTSAIRRGPAELQTNSVGILNTALLVMMILEIVYTVAVSLQSHTLEAEPFLIVGVIAAIRRILLITAIAIEHESHPEQFYNILVELGLLAGTIVALCVAIWILRYSASKYLKTGS